MQEKKRQTLDLCKTSGRHQLRFVRSGGFHGNSTIISRYAPCGKKIVAKKNHKRDKIRFSTDPTPGVVQQNDLKLHDIMQFPPGIASQAYFSFSERDIFVFAS